MPFKRLLEAVGFEADVFDEANSSRPAAAIVHARIVAADAVLVLLGPNERTEPRVPSEPSRWPHEECILAKTLSKPLAIIHHPGTRLPEMVAHAHTPASFDFWDADSFREQCGKVVKHLIDLRQQFEIPPGTQPFVFTKGVIRNRIQGKSLITQIYHEVWARQAWDGAFHHMLDMGLDKSKSAAIELLSEDVELEVLLGSGVHQISLNWGDVVQHGREYLINVSPGLGAGGKLGYRRGFELRNYFPTTLAQLEERSKEAGFPTLYKQDGKVYYGDVYDVMFEMDSITVAIHFPRSCSIKAVRALAFSLDTRHVNSEETARCSSSEMLRLDDAVDAGERVASLTVRRPLINYSYALLYELDR
jgi:hypothetical protein